MFLLRFSSSFTYFSSSFLSLPFSLSLTHTFVSFSRLSSTTLAFLANLSSSRSSPFSISQQQFATLHDAIDILIATPGRFLHLCVEMELRLSSIAYVVFDEADRLFEMGFAQQLNEILARLPEDVSWTLSLNTSLSSHMSLSLLAPNCAV